MPCSIDLRTPVAALLLAAILCCCALVALPAAPAAAQSKVKACPNANAERGDATPDQLGRAALCLINNERSKRGLVRLSLNKRLTEAARKHNDDMVENHYFRHESANGGNVIDRVLGTGYIKRALDWIVGENLAWGTEELATPRQITLSWMRSPGHRKNILTRRFRELGIAVAFAAPNARGR